VGKRKIRRKKSPVKLLHLLSFFAVFLLFGIIYLPSQLKQSTPCANSISCAKSPELKIENNSTGVFSNHKITPPKISMSDQETSPVLGASNELGEKHIYVDLTHQTLSAFAGKTLIMQVPISSGKWHPTPTGEFNIWIKLRATRMAGGQGDDFYDLPNVPYVMFFANSQVARSAGFSLHGAYWHNNFGHPMSHGCVNMRETDAHKLYDWASPPTTGYTTYADEKNTGTKVTVFGSAPI